MKDVIEDFLQEINTNETVIFFGAGVSLNSGIPIVYGFNDIDDNYHEGLVDNILGRTGINEIETRILKKSNLPFEGFVKTLTLFSDIDQILKIFNIGKENNFHNVMSWLSIKKSINTFITTNFDQHLEKSLSNNNIKYKSYYNEENFLKINFNDNDVNIIKLHGCISNKESIGITLNKVSNKEIGYYKEKILSDIFKDIKIKNICFFGYSCSDVFDIVPYIESINNSKQNILFIDHVNSNDSKIEPVSNKEYKNPFKNYLGKRYYINTDYLLKKISKKHSIHQSDINIIKAIDDPSWIKYIDLWWREYSKHGNYLLAILFYNISEFVLSEKYLRLYINEQHSANSKIVASCYVTLVTILNNLDKKNEAIKYAKLAITISKEIGDNSSLATSYLNLGELYLHKSEFNQSISFSKKSEGFFEKLKKSDRSNKDEYIEKIARVKANIGSCYQSLQEDETAKNYFLDALGISETSGELYTKIVVYRGLSFITAKEGNLLKSKEYAELAQNLSIKLGLKHHIASTFLDIGNLYRELGEIDKSQKLYKNAMVIFKETDNETGYYISLANMGIIYQTKQEFDKSEKAYSESIPHLTGTLKAIFLSNYGYLCKVLGNYNKSINLLNESIQISKNTGNLKNLRMALLNLGSTYLSLENDSKAEDYFLESLEIAIQINDKFGEARSLINLGVTHYNLGKLDATSKVNEGYKIFYNLLGESHHETLEAKILMNQLGGF